MGKYLSCGIADTIYINSLKDDKKDEEALARIGENIDLSIYDRIDKENDEYIILKIKKEVFEKNIASFIGEQLKFLDDYDKTSVNEVLERINGKTYDELIQASKFGGINAFYFKRGDEISNDISYLDSEGKCKIYCDLIQISQTGETFFECYRGMFTYFRNCIINSSENPLKTAMVITLTS